MLIVQRPRGIWKGVNDRGPWVNEGSSRDIWEQTYEYYSWQSFGPNGSRDYQTFSLLPSSTFHHAMFLENVFTRQRRCGMTWSNSPASCRHHPQVGIYCCCTQLLPQSLIGQSLPSVVVERLLAFGEFYHRQAAQHPGSMDECRVEGGEHITGEQ